MNLLKKKEKKRNRPIDTENKCMVTSGERGYCSVAQSCPTL